MTSKLLTVLDFSLKKRLLREFTLTIDLGVARVRCKPCLFAQVSCRELQNVIMTTKSESNLQQPKI